MSRQPSGIGRTFVVSQLWRGKNHAAYCSGSVVKNSG